MELLIFELPRDTEGYSGHGNLIVLGAYDVSDARRAVEVALTLIDEKAERIYINEVGHMEMHVTANAGPVLHQIFDAPLGKAFGFICAGPAGIAIVAADTAVKSSPVDIVWYGTPSINLSRTNEVIIGVSGDYEMCIRDSRMADAELEAADFTRDEVKEGVQELLKIYDQENFGTIFR